MKKDKKYTVIDKKELFDYLDGYSFIDENEVQMCICDFIENKEGKLYYSDGALACELCNEYINKKELYNIDYIDDDGNIVDFSKGF